LCNPACLDASSANMANSTDSNMEDHMKDAIKKVLFKKLKSLPDNKNLSLTDLQSAFKQTTGHRINEHFDEFQAVTEELQRAEYARFSKLPNGSVRIVKGLDFDTWENSMTPGSTSNQFNISSLNAQNVQVGDGNTMNVNVTPEAFLSALNKMQQDPEKAESVLSKLYGYVNKGLSLTETVAKFIALFSS
jgi:hypothetical protein